MESVSTFLGNNEIVAHRKAFTAWSGLDYSTHNPQTISFVPPTEIESILRNDYEQMKYGFIYKDAPEYDILIEKITDLQQEFRNLAWAK